MAKTEWREPTSPIEAYKAMIDQLVNETSHGVSERLVIEKGTYPGSVTEDHLDPFVQSLSHEQRSMLAEIIHNERVGAIHDVLALLTWWITARDVGFTFRGQAMPVELSGTGLHGDYIGRLNDWEWPDDTDVA